MQRIDAPEHQATVATESDAETRFLDLVDVGYLDELDWYNVTIIDVDRFVDRRLFKPITP